MCFNLKSHVQVILILSKKGLPDGQILIEPEFMLLYVGNFLTIFKDPCNFCGMHTVVEYPNENCQLYTSGDH